MRHRPCCVLQGGLRIKRLPSSRPADQATISLPSPESAVSSSSALKFPPKRCTSGSLSGSESNNSAGRQHIYDYHRPEALHFPIGDFVPSPFPLERGMSDMWHSYRRAKRIPIRIVSKAFNEYASRLRQFGRGAERAIGFTFRTCSTTAALYTPCRALEVGASRPRPAGGRPGRLGWVSFLGGRWWDERGRRRQRCAGAVL